MTDQFLVLFQMKGAKKVVDIIILWETENLALSFSPFALLADLWHLSTCLFIIRVLMKSKQPAPQPRCTHQHMLSASVR